MADLDDPAARGGEVDEAPGVVRVGGNRLLDHDVAAGLEQRARDVGMAHGRRGHDGGVDRLRQRVERVESLQLQRRSDLRRDRVIRVDEAGDLDLRHFGQDARVQAAEVSGSDDSDAHQRMIPRFEPRMKSAK